VPHSDPPAGTAIRPGERTLRALTGVRSGKNSYYREMRRVEERMSSSVRALEGISTALVHTRDDPRALLRQVLLAAADHLTSEWTMIALRPGALPGVLERFLAVGPERRILSSALSLPATLREQLTGTGHFTGSPVVRDGWVRVPMELDGQLLGQLVASHAGSDEIEHEDLWVLRILVNQGALALHTAVMYSTAADLRSRAQELYDQIARSSQDLETRTAELARAEEQLRLLRERELLDSERHRIALELHDSVAQHVLSAGLAVEVCRAEAADRGAPAEAVERLAGARDLIATAGDQVRSVIYALDHEPGGGEPPGLPQLLEGLTAQHRGGLAVQLRVEGRPVQLGPAQVRALARLAGEALFNVGAHAAATTAVIRLRYTDRGLSLSVSDDGVGDPRELRRLLRLEQRGDTDGRHQGLAGMSRRATELGGRFSIRRSALGGVAIGVTLPATGPDEEA